METGMIVITSVLFAVILVPTLLIFQNSKKQSNTLFNGLKEVVGRDNGTLTRHIEHSNYALGIDETTRILYFFKKKEDTTVSKKIDLKLVTSCEVSTQKRRTRKKKGFVEVVEKIDLLFIQQNKDKVAHIALYNEDESLLTDELTIAENWKNSIQNLLLDHKANSAQENKQKVSVALL